MNHSKTVLGALSLESAPVARPGIFPTTPAGIVPQGRRSLSQSNLKEHLMRTHYSHSTRDGHKLVTIIELGGARELDISTRKGLGGALESRASVHLCSGNSRRHVIGFNGDGDFNRLFLSTSPKRVTEKVAREQHTLILAQVESIKLAVEMHYAAQERKEPAHA
ncbi:hypothetical protein [Delftia sp. GW456-R20]|nr:hypothetical protein [Delftia sp. GW456-R20]